LNLVGKPCTLHPSSDDGIRLPRKIYMSVIARAFHTAVEEELERAGLGVKLVGPGDPDEGIVVTGRFRKVTPGTRWRRYLFPFLPGAAAIVEVRGWLRTVRSRSPTSAAWASVASVRSAAPRRPCSRA